MVELETEVCLAVLDSYLGKTPAQRTAKHQKLAQEAVEKLAFKQAQFSEKDWTLYERFLKETSETE